MGTARLTAHLKAGRCALVSASVWLNRLCFSHSIETTGTLRASARSSIPAIPATSCLRTSLCTSSTHRRPPVPAPPEGAACSSAAPAKPGPPPPPPRVGKSARTSAPAARSRLAHPMARHLASPRGTKTCPANSGGRGGGRAVSAATAAARSAACWLLACLPPSAGGGRPLAIVRPPSPPLAPPAWLGMRCNGRGGR